MEPWDEKDNSNLFSGFTVDGFASGLRPKSVHIFLEQGADGKISSTNARWLKKGTNLKPPEFSSRRLKPPTTMPHAVDRWSARSEAWDGRREALHPSMVAVDMDRPIPVSPLNFLSEAGISGRLSPLGGSFVELDGLSLSHSLSGAMQEHSFQQKGGLQQESTRSSVHNGTFNQYNGNLRQQSSIARKLLPKGGFPGIKIGREPPLGPDGDDLHVAMLCRLYDWQKNGLQGTALLEQKSVAHTQLLRASSGQSQWMMDRAARRKRTSQLPVFTSVLPLYDNQRRAEEVLMLDCVITEECINHEVPSRRPVSAPVHNEIAHHRPDLDKRTLLMRSRPATGSAQPGLQDSRPKLASFLDDRHNMASFHEPAAQPQTAMGHITSIPGQSALSVYLDKIPPRVILRHAGDDAVSPRGGQSKLTRDEQRGTLTPRSSPHDCARLASGTSSRSAIFLKRSGTAMHVNFPSNLAHTDDELIARAESHLSMRARSVPTTLRQSDWGYAAVDDEIGKEDLTVSCGKEQDGHREDQTPSRASRASTKRAEQMEVYLCDRSRAKEKPSAELFVDLVTLNDVLEVVGHVAQLDSKSQARAESRPGAGHISRPSTGRMIKRDLELGAHKAGVVKKKRSSGS